MSSPIVGPIAPENNPPINPQYYQPSVFFISALSYGVTTLVTTSVDNNYVIGQTIRLLIPQGFGATQLRYKQGNVIAIPQTNQVLTDINSQVVDPFIPNAVGNTKPQIIAIGDSNSGNISTNGRVILPLIPGSFINISPQ